MPTDPFAKFEEFGNPFEQKNVTHTPGGATSTDPFAQFESAGNPFVEKQVDKESSDFIPGVQRGVQNLQASAYGVGALAGKGLQEIGFEEAGKKLQNAGLEGYKRNIAEAEQYEPKNSFKDVYTGKAGIGGAVDWAQGTLGELVPSMVEAAIGATAGSLMSPGAGTATGAFAGRTILKKSIDEVVKKTVKEGTEKAVEDQIRKQVTSQALKKLGGKVGMGAAVFPMETGGMYAELLESHGVDAPGTAMLFGGLATAMEYAGGNSKLVDTFVDALAKGSTGMAKKSAKEILMNIPQEAMQEGGQELMNVLNTVVNTDEKLLTGANLERIIESMAAGAIGGGAGAGAEYVMDGRKINKPSEFDNQVSKITSGGVENINKTLTEFDKQDAFNASILQDPEKLKAHADVLSIPSERLAENLNKQTIVNQQLRDRLKVELARPIEEVKPTVDPITDDVINAKINELRLGQEERTQKVSTLNTEADKLRKIFYKTPEGVEKEALKTQIISLISSRNALVNETKQTEQKIIDFAAPKKSDEIRAELQDFYTNVWSDKNNVSKTKEAILNNIEPSYTDVNKDAVESAKILNDNYDQLDPVGHLRNDGLVDFASPKTADELLAERQEFVKKHWATQYGNSFRPEITEKEAKESAEFINDNYPEVKIRLDQLLDQINTETNNSRKQQLQKIYDDVFSSYTPAKSAEESAKVFAEQLASTESSPFTNERPVGTTGIDNTLVDSSNTNVTTTPTEVTTTSVETPSNIVSSIPVEPITNVTTQTDDIDTTLNQYAKTFKEAYVIGDIEIPEYMTVLDLIAKKDIEALTKISNAINQTKQSEADPMFARDSSFKAKGKADLGRLIKMLGSQMYKGNLAEVTIKEVVQNSFDAVKASLNTKGAKGITDGRIDITVDPSNRIIAIKDNGQGMSKDVLLNAFLTVAGTDKSGLAAGDASGGFGMAKAAFLYGNEWIEVNTVKNGHRYKFKANGNELLSKEINISDEAANKNEHGTVITIKVPESVEINGEQKSVWFPYDVEAIEFFKQPLIHDAIEINLQKTYLSEDSINTLSNPNNEIWNKENFTSIQTGKNFDLSKYEKNTTIHFDWGDAELFIAKNRNPDNWSIRHNVLSAGVFQFTHDFNIAPYEKIPYDVILNVFPKVNADSASYPFNIKREGWKDTIAKDIKSLNAYVKNVALGFEAEGTVEQFKNIKSLPKIDINDIGTNNVDITDFLTKKPVTKSDETKVKAVIKMPKITVSDGQVKGKNEAGDEVILVDTNKKDDEKVNESFKSEKEVPKAKDFLIDVGIDDSQPILHNNTNVDFIALASENGYSAETLFAELGSLMLKVKEVLAEKTGWGYESLRDKDKSVFVGISIDKKYHGVNLVVPFQAILLNPLAVKSRTLPGLVHGYYDTIMHEFTHVPKRNHEESFILEKGSLDNLLASDGTDLEIRVALGRILKKHKALLNLMRDEYEKSTTTNLAKALNDNKDSDAVASSRYPNGSDGSIENGNAERTGAINSARGQADSNGISTGFTNGSGNVNITPEQIAQAINPAIKYDGLMQGIPGVIDDLHNFTITLPDGKQPSFSITGKVTSEKLTKQLNKVTARFKQNSNENVKFQVAETLEQVISDDVYNQMFNERNNWVRKIGQTLRMRGTEFKQLLDKGFGSISTRLKNVDPMLAAEMRNLDFRTSQKIVSALRIAHPLLDATKRMSAEDKFIWDAARRNSDEGKIKQLAEKYNITADQENLRTVLNQIRQDAIDVGYAVGFIDEYWPRIIKDQEGFLQATKGISNQPVFSNALKVQADKLGMSVDRFQVEYPEVAADIISNTILGRNLGIGGPGNIQARQYDTVPPELNKYYMDSDAALMQYIYSMTKKIEVRRFFGKVPERISGLKADKKRKDGQIISYNKILQNATPEEKAEFNKRINDISGDLIRIEQELDKYKLQRDYTENIGAYIDDLILTGRISKDEERIVRNILDARFHEHGTTGLINAYKNIAYIDVMGSPISAITQIGDLAWAMYVGKVWTPRGLSNTVKNIGKSITKNSEITKEDLGIERIAQEFADGTTLGNAVSWVFKKVGLEKMDSIGKEVLINNALDNYKAMVQTEAGRTSLTKYLKPIFGTQSDSVIQDLVANNHSENVKMLLYHRLLDFQPVALSEMPEQYLKSGNGRIFYMLKTYTLKQFDVFRNEAWHKIKTGERDQIIEGIGNMIKLTSLLALANAGADELKDLLLGKDVKFKDHVIENFLTMGGASRYVKMQIKQDGLGAGLIRQILPPFKFIDALSKDVAELRDQQVAGDILDFNQSRIVESLPIGGKLYYWHYGRGEDYKKSANEQSFKDVGTEVNMFKRQLENADNKRDFIYANIVKFKQMKLHENFQSALSRNQAVINKLKKVPETTNVIERLGKLKEQREILLERYFEASKGLQ